MSEQDTPDGGYHDNDTAGGTVSTRYVSTHISTSPPVVAVYARLIASDLDAIRALVREEVHRALYPESEDMAETDTRPVEYGTDGFGGITLRYLDEEVG